jgi:hypothetical protein
MSPKTAAKSKSASAKTADKTGAKQSESPNYTPTHALLALWSLEKKEGKAISKGKLSKYKSLIEELVKDEAIEVDEGKRYSYLSIAESGKESLIQGLQAADFNFGGTIASSREVNDALELLRQHSNGSVSVAETNGKAVETIASYDEFKQVALGVYDRLNRDYNMDNLVPIYRIRREIGDRVSRSEFDEWLLEMQTQDICQLIGGEMPELTPDKAEDSIKTALGGVRYYAKQL